MTTSPTYSLQQQTFVLSLLSNGVSGIRNSTPQQLASQLQQSVTQALGPQSPFVPFIGSSWSVVWGPAVSVQNDSGVADNAMFVSHDPTQQVYVVAIAGTNAVSNYDVATEDLTLNPLVALSASANITTGTSDGITALEAMTDPATGTTLQAFLNGLGNQQVIFTGHSLGGALSPALALDLVVNKGLKIPPSSIRVYPTAGPTPGDSGFVSLFRETFTPQPASGATPVYNSWNVVVWNKLDIVPHAWSMLGAIPTLYAPTIPALSCVQAVITYLTNCVVAGTTLAQLPNVSFAGTIQKPATLVPLYNFVAEAAYQHVEAYYQQIVPQLASQFKPLPPVVIAALALELEKFCGTNPNGQC